MTARGRHTARHLTAELNPAQLQTVADTLTTDQLRAAMRHLIDADRRLARNVIDAAIAECPIQPPPPPEMIP